MEPRDPRGSIEGAPCKPTSWPRGAIPIGPRGPSQ
jgi:hypothetical protein